MLDSPPETPYESPTGSPVSPGCGPGELGRLAIARSIPPGRTPPITPASPRLVRLRLAVELCRRVQRTLAVQRGAQRGWRGGGPRGGSAADAAVAGSVAARRLAERQW